MLSHHEWNSTLAHIETVRHHGVPVLAVSGEVDCCTVDEMLAEVDEHLKARPPAMVLDLTAVTFFGSAGLRLVLHASMGAKQLDSAFAVVAARSVVLKPMRVSQVDEAVLLRPDLHSALAAVSASGR